MADPRSTEAPEASQRLGKYRLIAQLGSGGMARVFLGVVSGPNGFNKLYVLKVLRSDVDAEQRVELLKMFQDEGRLAARLNHPHIVQSHEIGCEAGEHFIAMEYLEGQPLSRVQELWQAADDCFPLPLRLFVIGQLLDALDYAHRVHDYDGTPLEIVHRDVSPQNVFVSYAGHSKLLDFGIAKTQASRQTRAGVLKGKLPYMAPEQVKTLPLDQRTDIFSVGVMLWECIAGQLLFAGSTAYEMLTRLVTADIPRLRDVVADVPPLLDELVARALAVDPNARQADARTLRAELLAFEPLSRVSARDVADRIQVLFADERNELERLIRAAVGSATRGGGVTFAEQQGVGLPRFRPPPLVARTASTVASATPTLAALPRSEAPSPSAMKTTPITAQMPPRVAPLSAAPTAVSALPPRVRRSIAPGVAVGAVGAVAVVFALRRLGSVTPSPGDAPARPAQSAAAATLPTAPATALPTPPAATQTPPSSTANAPASSLPSALAAPARTPSAHAPPAHSKRPLPRAEPSASVPPAVPPSAKTPNPASRPDDSYIRDLPPPLRSTPAPRGPGPR